MRIARDGTWYHEGTPIDRPAMVRLFSTVLRREPDGSHVLVTPVEKLTIDVEATAFRATQMTMAGEGENAAHRLDARQRRRPDRRPDHPLYVVDTDQGPRPRIAVRFGLEAELARPLYYELAEIALAEGQTRPASGPTAAFFALACQ